MGHEQGEISAFRAGGRPAASVVGAAIALSGCYSPRLFGGEPCGAGVGPCATGQQCVAAGSESVCRPAGSQPPDASPVDAPAALDDALGPVDAPVATGYAGVVLADHPVGYWRLGDTGAIAFDRSGHAATGSYSGSIARGVPGAIAGDSDKAVAFDGDTASIPVGSFDFPGTAAFSIEAWIKPAGSDGNYHHVFTKEHRDPPWWGYALLVTNVGYLKFERFIDDAERSVAVPLTLPATSFLHAVASYDGSTVRLFVNGELADSEAAIDAMKAVDEPALIGAAFQADSTTLEATFDGSLDEIAVYAEALSAAQVKAHFVAGTQQP